MDVRVKSVDIRTLQAPLLQPFRIAIGQHDILDNLLVVLKLSDGTVGFGEAAIASHITGETVSRTRENLHRADQYLRNQNPQDYLAISSWLNGSFPKNKAAVAAIEVALLDALTRRMNMPLWKMFGNKPYRLKTDITLVISSLEQTREKAKEFYKRGFRSFKIKIGHDMDLDIKRVQATVKLAPGARIILDANQAYNDQQALKFLNTIQRHRIKVDLIEQPVAKADWEGLKRISQLSSVPVCADESASSLADVIGLIKHKAVDVINIKLMKTGLIQSFEIACLARAAGLKLMIGGMMESNLAMTAAAHMAAGLGCFDFVDLDTPFFIKGEAEENPYLSHSGIYDAAKTTKGIGIRPV